MPPEKILVIAGRYDIIRVIHTTFQDSEIHIDYAFNHRDAIYILNQQRYHHIIVDAEMTDRHSGDTTLHMLIQAGLTTRITPIVLNEKAALNAEDIPETEHITKLEKRNITKHIKVSPAQKSLGTTPFNNPEAFIDKSQIDKLEPLFELTKLLTEVLDFKEVLNRIVEVARELTDANESVILLPLEGELYLRARITDGMKNAKNYQIKSDDEAALKVFKTVSTQYSKTLPDKTTFFYMPIIHQNKPIGVLGVRDESVPLADNYRSLLKHIASLAAIALHNANIHQRSVSRTNELETLITMSDELNKSLSLADILETTTKQLAESIDVGHTEILRWSDSNKLYTAARHYQLSWFFGQGTIIDISDYRMTHNAINNVEPAWVERNDASDKKDTKEYCAVTNANANTLLILPVTTDNRVVGLIRAFYLAPSDESLSKESLYQIVQDELAVLLGSLDNAAMTVPGSFHRITKRINNKLKANWTEILLPIKANKQFITLSRVGGGVWLEEHEPSFDVSLYPELRERLNSKQPFVTSLSDNNITKWGEIFLEKSQLHSILCIPLVQRDSIQGLVICGTTSSNEMFRQNQIDLARAMVGQAAITMENATLMHELQISLDRLITTQDQLIQTARLSAMGEMADVVAHQINNPLTTIIAEAELLLTDQQDEDSLQYSSLKAISHTGKRAASVVRGLLSISRSKNEKATSIDLVSSIDNVISLLRPNFERANIQILMNSPETPIPAIKSTYGQLEDIWFNLLMNAHQAVNDRENAKVGIDIDYDSNHKNVRIVVWDNGVGISPKLLPHVFEAFFTTKQSGEATGLGLYISQQIIKNIGGTIVIESEPDIRTSVIINLPVPPI